MCRWIAYLGQPIFLDTLITRPSHSLVEQSLNAVQHFRSDGSIWSTNGDGFGVGWYNQKPEPGLFKGDSPAWNNENLHEICSQTQSHLFMAHVRATTTGAVQRSNSHPFKYKNWLFQHNGHVNHFEKLRRDLQFDIAPDLFPHVEGTTDSETFFYLALTYGLQKDPKGALEKMIDRVKKAAQDNSVELTLNLSCALSNGQALYTIRHASGDGEKPKSQYFSVKPDSVQDLAGSLQRISHDSVIVVSEPLDQLQNSWEETPPDSFLEIRDGDVKISELLL